MIEMLGDTYSRLFDEFYVSCEIDANKSSQTAYHYIKKAFCLEPQKCIMIGDNIVSDIYNAKLNGFKTKFIRTNGIM